MIRSAKSNRAPSPAGQGLLGKLSDVRYDRLGLLRCLTAEYGPVVRFRIGPRWIHVVAEPLSARHILVENATNYHKGIGEDYARSFLGDGVLTAEGSAWTRQRAYVQGLFKGPERDRQLDAIREALVETESRWHALAATGQPIRILDEMMGLTLKAMWRLMFGDDIGDRDTPIRAALAAAFADVGKRIISPVTFPYWVPTAPNRDLRGAMRDLDRLIDHAVAMRANKPGTMLSQIAELAESPRELRDQVVTLLFSGHETSAVAAVWALYAASLDPQVWQRLRDNDVNEDKTIAGMRRYEEMVIHEVLRLYPPIWAIPRVAIGRDRILDQIDIPARSTIIVSPYLMHREAAVWHEPEEFRPQRFYEGVPPEGRTRYLPFGVGGRACVGRGFAMLTLSEILRSIPRLFTLQFPGGEPRPEPLLTLRPPNDLYVRLIR
jgi:enediyne biosynthesis protein E7